MNLNVDGDASDGTERGQEPHGICRGETEDVLPFADDDKRLLVVVVRIDVLNRCGDQLVGKFGGKSDRKRHSTLQGGVGTGPVSIVVIVVPNLKWTVFEKPCKLTYNERGLKWKKSITGRALQCVAVIVSFFVHRKHQSPPFFYVERQCIRHI